MLRWKKAGYLLQRSKTMTQNCATTYCIATTATFTFPATTYLEKMEPRPAVNYGMLKKHTGRMVSVIGKVLDINSSGNQLKLLMSDKTDVRVSLKDSLEELLQGYVQITATVENDGTLTAEHIISFGNGEIDLSRYDEAVQLAARYPELFGLDQTNTLSY